MRKIPILTLVLIVVSTLWFFYWLIEGLTTQYSGYADDSFYLAIVPLVVFWGIFWIIEGVKQKRKEKSK
jgi:hypothetical protein